MILTRAASSEATGRIVLGDELRLLVSHLLCCLHINTSRVFSHLFYLQTGYFTDIRDFHDKANINTKRVFLQKIKYFASVFKNYELYKTNFHNKQKHKQSTKFFIS